MSFTDGAKDGKHYWLTLVDLMSEIYKEFEITFDPCPFPKPEGFDGLAVEWGESNYVNPPFGGYVDDNGKRKGPTAWAKKVIEEHKKGKTVVFVYPIDKWVHMMIEAGAEIRNLRVIRWLATEDGLPGKGTGRWVAEFILRGKKDK